MEGYPQTRQELIDRIRAARAELEQLLSTLSAAAMERPAPDGGWAVKDHLAHLAEWRRQQIGLIDGRPGYEALGVSQDLYEHGGIDRLNAALYERHRDRSVDDVLIDFRASHEAMLERIEQMEDADLRRANDLTNPADKRALVEGIASNSYEHDEEHNEWIRELVSSAG